MSGNDATMRRWMLTGASALAAKKRRAAGLKRSTRDRWKGGTKQRLKLQRYQTQS